MKINENTRIVGSKVVLVPYKKKYVERYHQWMKSEELQYLTGSEPLTIEEEYQMQESWHNDDNKCTFIILDRNRFDKTNPVDSMIGDTNLYLNDIEEPFTAECEIMIAEKCARGQKMGWEALILILRYGIEALKINKYRAKIKIDNEKSIKMFNKLRFNEIIEKMSFSKLKSAAIKFRPLFFNSVAYGSFYTGAEFLQQTYNINQKEKAVSMSKYLTFIIKLLNNTPVNSNKLFPDKFKLEDYNVPVLRRYLTYGYFLAGPILHGWYSWLDKMFKGTAPKIVVTKLLCDQFILTPPLVVLFFTSMSVMEGKKTENLLDECKAKFVKTFATSCIFWLPVQFVNFLLIPPSFRVLYVSVASFCWVNILCHLKRTPIVPAVELKTK
ncbi:GSCOCG00000519001-RA-CDS [Cotesia congregata]|nr:GSCOCG00000519001-RA-CDS [Cotesia congregata]